jgi:hypothetical protein
MVEANQIRERLANALQGNESFSDFAEWLSQESASLRFEDKALLDLADSVLSPLQMYFDSLIDESELRSELKAFVNPNEIQEREVQIVFDDPPVSRGLLKPDIRRFNSSVQVQGA